MSPLSCTHGTSTVESYWGPQDGRDRCHPRLLVIWSASKDTRYQASWLALRHMQSSPYYQNVKTWVSFLEENRMILLCCLSGMGTRTSSRKDHRSTNPAARHFSWLLEVRIGKTIRTMKFRVLVFSDDSHLATFDNSDWLTCTGKRKNS